MEEINTPFDMEVHRRKTDVLRTNFREGLEWKYEIRNGDNYVFDLGSGDKLEIVDFLVKKDEQTYDISHVLLAQLNGVTVGFARILIYLPNKDRIVGEAKSNLEVIIKGKGIGGRLDRVKNHILQSVANTSGDIDDHLQDENRDFVRSELESVKEEFKISGNRDLYRKKLQELSRDRRIWLKLYGPDGKSGYDWSSRTRPVRHFTKGGVVDISDCIVQKNEKNLVREVGKMK